jgi:hypothetical protein
LRRKSMTARFIPTQVHAVLDYLTGGVLVCAPRLFGITDEPVAARVLEVAGGGATAYSMITDYELGLVKVLPMRTHLMLDAGSGALMAASPWLFGFARRGSRYWLPHVLFGATEILAALSTKTR